MNHIVFYAPESILLRGMKSMEVYNCRVLINISVLHASIFKMDNQ